MGTLSFAFPFPDMFTAVHYHCSALSPQALSPQFTITTVHFHRSALSPQCTITTVQYHCSALSLECTITTVHYHHIALSLQCTITTMHYQHNAITLSQSPYRYRHDEMQQLNQYIYINKCESPYVCSLVS